ncbi:MAG TPA: adenylate/guanylate cyclase domain-containing protein, partial [Oxalicibacterium sp.]|nr:adenylate/guanylate cyclase domain-containing protein [Oxalicibacterium sp.]
MALTAYALTFTIHPVSGSVIERIDQYFCDLRMRTQHAQPDSRVVIVDIDEKSIAAIGRWPWSRDVVADLVTSLTDHYHVKALGFDIIFAEPDTSSGYATMEKLARTTFRSMPQLQQQLQALKPVLDYDGRLAAAIKGKPVVMGYLFSSEPASVSKGVLPAPAFTSDDLEGRKLDTYAWRSYTANLPQLQAAAAGSGFFNPVLDADGVVRSVPLIARIGDKYYESLAVATARVALGAQSARPVPFESKELREYGALQSLALDDPQVTHLIPVERNLTTLVNYRSAGGVDQSHLRYLSAVDVIHHRLPAAELDGKIVLVGTTVPGLYDLRATPVSPNYPGVEIHANIIESILDGAFLQRPDFSQGYDLLQVLAVGLLLAILLPLLGPFSAFLLAGGAALAISGLNFWLYQAHYLVLPMATALLLIAVLFVMNLAWSYLFEFRNRHAMVHLFGEYVAPELVAEMAANPKNYSMESESRELTVLFSDVRGFTTISETLPPGELREYINAYLTAMSEDIRGNRGTLDKYIGDAVMAFWGAPVPLVNHAALAVASALTMQQTVVRLNADFAKRNWPPLHIGVGLNTGEMRVGDMGSQVRRAYTVMGDAVNLGSRLESITKVYDVGIIVGVGTRNAAPDYAYRELDRVRVKGKNEPVPIFEPLGLNSELDATARSVLDQWHEALAHFRAQRLDDAEPLLLTLQSTQPHPLYALYLQRIDTYRHHPLPADWDGVTTFDT